MKNFKITQISSVFVWADLFSNAALGIKPINHLDTNVAEVPCFFLSLLSQSGTEELPGIGHLPFLFRIRTPVRFSALKDVQLTDFLRKP